MIDFGYCAIGTVLLTVLSLVLYHAIKNKWDFDKNIWKEILISLGLSAGVVAIMTAALVLKGSVESSEDMKDVNLVVEKISEVSPQPDSDGPHEKARIETPKQILDDEYTVKTGISPSPSASPSDSPEDELLAEDTPETEEEALAEEEPVAEEGAFDEEAAGDRTPEGEGAATASQEEPSEEVTPEIHDETSQDTPSQDTSNTSDEDFHYSTTGIDVTSEKYRYHEYIDVEYILPDSDKRNYDESEIEGLTAKQCILARNEMYARHGRAFTNVDLEAYFETKSWYSPMIPADEFNNSVLNKYEVYNKKLVTEYEKKMGFK